MVRMNCEEGWIGHFGGQGRLAQLARGRVAFAAIDTFALAASVAADVDPKLGFFHRRVFSPESHGCGHSYIWVFLGPLLAALAAEENGLVFDHDFDRLTHFAETVFRLHGTILL